jgi:ADP-heptose:LPS heptosyltransferase
MSIGKGLPLTVERWPVQQFAHIADAVADATDCRIVLTGSPDEKPLVDAVAACMLRPSLNLAGTTSLLQLAAVMSLCRAFVCPDSGPMHMAAAVGVPTVGIFAMRCEFPDRWRPYGDRCVVVRPDPIVCPVGCQKETCASFACYRQLSPAPVAAAVQQMLAAAGDCSRC